MNNIKSPLRVDDLVRESTTGSLLMLQDSINFVTKSPSPLRKYQNKVF